MEHRAGPRQLRRLLDGVLAISSDLDLPSVLRRIVATAAELAQAQYGALGVLDPSGTRLSEFITVGLSDGQRTAIGELPEGHGILGLLIVDPEPLRLADLHAHPGRFGIPPNHPPMTSFLGVPITVRGVVFGNLYLCDKAGGDTFTEVDQELVTSLAAAAGIAIDNARLHARVAELATVEDRERIARELHDTVMQRLFAISLSLQASLRLVDDQRATERINRAVADLDVTVRDVRSAIFELHTRRRLGRSLRDEVVQLIAEASRTLGFEPELCLVGPIDTVVGDQLADEVCAVIREALSNVAKHADASAVAVTVGAVDGLVAVRIIDDGRGFDPTPTGGRGMDNLRERAVRHGGTFEVVPSARGTDVVWSVPWRT
ncbi:MAG: putative signal transduction histidine kinase [Ilumatobacteraceae bacterium]|nr:putative signal transduction histidine kinase [Ilumatobacteraceae bacterium]